METKLCERYTDNGELSHYECISVNTGELIYSIDPETKQHLDTYIYAQYCSQAQIISAVSKWTANTYKERNDFIKYVKEQFKNKKRDV